jgi:BirA family biotin operon repressor/biotin-[acetyl-CoA-carboxylase] ligase
VVAKLMTESLPTWRVLRFDELSSTSDVAAREQAWTAVIARRQTKGRGRYRRTWVSDEGGIWLSAVLPTPGPASAWSILPLAAGWALRETLAGFGLGGMHLRWPNDLMIGPAKLAGILVERFTPETAVIGIGINYDNSPDSVEKNLSGCVTRIVDLLKPAPTSEELVGALLGHFGIAQRRIEAGQTRAFIPSLNQAWQIDRVRVVLNDSHREVLGSFLGVDETGRLRVRTFDGVNLELLPNEVELLRELPNG